MATYKIFAIVSIFGLSVSGRSYPVTHQSLADVSNSNPRAPNFQFFTPEAPKKSNENCEKVIKNGMMCFVCKDPQKKGQLEQCAYLSHPPKKYSGHKKVKPEPDIDELGPKPTKNNEKKLRRYDESSESDDNSNYSAEFDTFDYYPDYTTKSETSAKLTDDKNDCHDVRRDDGSICTVCKNSKNGGNSERCRREYQPKENVYSYRKSNSFGYPKKSVGNKGTKSKKGDDKGQQSQSYRRRDSNDDDNDDTDSYDYDGAEDRRGSENCEEEERDGMICKICLNPSTNGKSEQCSYSYQPEDKLFAYTNKRSFGDHGDRDD
ncbi:uncharacterized protein DDB_G0283697-like [Microplitis mediator]|uniref:uncharacterized protein DDB_G0283697-like n=1 Tax=Microplitis mediator TaxID=375433 RepID=UPI00255343AC|nr:uncharacterized protein DDB_G0283697-like [Microplitis mediator]